MKLTNGEIFEAVEPLKLLLAERFPVATSFKLAQMAGKLNDRLEDIEPVRVGLFKTYGTTTDDGQLTVPANCENFPKFASEMEDLMAQEVEVVITKVKLPDDTSAEIRPGDMMALAKFVEV
jgi:hypothetical protein